MSDPAPERLKPDFFSRKAGASQPQVLDLARFVIDIYDAVSYLTPKKRAFTQTSGYIMKSIMTVDVARLASTGADAEAMLDDSLNKIRRSPNLQVLKVVHGEEHEGQSPALKSAVKNWVDKNHNKIISSIDGAELLPTNPHVQVLLAECSLSEKKDFSSPDKGVTIVWVT